MSGFPAKIQLFDPKLGALHVVIAGTTGSGKGGTGQMISLAFHANKILGEAPKMPGVRVAVYFIDQTRLDDAPLLAATITRAEERTAVAARAAELRAQEEEDRFLGPDDY